MVGGGWDLAPGTVVISFGGSKPPPYRMGMNGRPTVRKGASWKSVAKILYAKVLTSLQFECKIKQK